MAYTLKKLYFKGENGAMSDNIATIHIDKNLKFLNVDFSDIYNLTSKFKSLSFNYYGTTEGKQTNQNNIYLSMEQDYLFATSKTRKSFMVVKIDNSTPLSTQEIILAETLLKAHFYQPLLKSDPALLNKVVAKSTQFSLDPHKTNSLDIIKILAEVENGEIEEIQILPNEELKCNKPKELSSDELEDIAAAWEQCLPTTKSIDLTLTASGMDIPYGYEQ